MRIACATNSASSRICAGIDAFRSAREVALRAQALLIVALQGEALATKGNPLIDRLRMEFPAGFDALSPLEAEFLRTAAPEEQLLINFVWRYEALQVLAWALELVETLPEPVHVCDAEALVRVVQSGARINTRSRPRLRQPAEILDVLDEHFCLHWLAVQARQKGMSPPNGIHEGIIRERHHALNWLASFLRAAWDDVQTPT
ncbi:DUF4272 domain-containing protein [Pandoraea iniqua]|uniref:DUF4272 domain-containing protein n=1 Tax=Pandoraea iniqua TaxID=2508288 RepID=UPI001240BBC1|nr:DUF4272 domain-containing protein [Pandoraea iniqua]